MVTFPLDYGRLICPLHTLLLGSRIPVMRNALRVLLWPSSNAAVQPNSNLAGGFQAPGRRTQRKEPALKRGPMLRFACFHRCRNQPKSAETTAVTISDRRRVSQISAVRSRGWPCRGRRSWQDRPTRRRSRPSQPTRGQGHYASARWRVYRGAAPHKPLRFSCFACFGQNRIPARD